VRDEFILSSSFPVSSFAVSPSSFKYTFRKIRISEGTLRVYSRIYRKRKEYESKQAHGWRKIADLRITNLCSSIQSRLNERICLTEQDRWDECEGKNERRIEVEGDDVDDDAMRTTVGDDEIVRRRRDVYITDHENQTTRTSGHRCGNDRQAARSAVTIVDR